ncbi:MAG: hypothetical protein R3B09_11830 [Nannocystaceae bacterium]
METKSSTSRGSGGQGSERGAAISAEVVIPCEDLGATLEFFTARLGLRVESIFPADDPAVAVIAGYGVRLCLERGAAGPAPTLRLRGAALDGLADADADEIVGPGGVRVLLAPAEAPVVVPPLRPAFVHQRASGDARWGVGRAGMGYRDLIPGRLGGRFIASQIRIVDGGPVPDYVHFHRVRFQMIYCRRGWVRVVYEDQGPPFVMEAGDCVVQPPQIRHRVLESSAGLEVVELTCPAEHETHADPSTTLPNDVLRPERAFSGQRFVRHVAAAASWGPIAAGGYEARDLGIGGATEGLAGARVLRRVGPPTALPLAHAGELRFLFVLGGSASLARSGGAAAIDVDDAIVIPAGDDAAIVEPSDDLEVLMIELPASIGR